MGRLFAAPHLSTMYESPSLPQHDMMTDDHGPPTSDDEPSEIPTARMFAWARNSAAYRLGSRMMTEKQLSDAIRKKARQKFQDISDAQLAALCETALKFGRDIKALDDVAYATIATRSAVRSGRSKRLISQKLILKGIDRETVSDATQDKDDLYAAVVFARKRAFGPFRKAAFDEARKSKELSAFGRQGFGFEIGKTVVALNFEEAEEILRSASIS